MAFQFLCPQGHLLQGEESRAGQQCNCPYCGTLFLIPQPVPAPAAAPVGPVTPPAPVSNVAPIPDAGQAGFPGIRTDVEPATSAAKAAAAKASPITEDLPELVHIPCPTGHSLETPREWLGKLAMCPFCQQKFRLKWKKSSEYRQRRQEELELRQARTARLWLQWSIGSAVVVVLGLILAFVLF